MDSSLSHSYLAAPCLAISAALFFLGSGLAPIWVCAWLAAIPVLWISSRVSGKQAFFLGAAAYALGGLNEWSYSRQVLPTWLVAAILLFSACLCGLGVVLFRGRILQGRIWQAVVVLPAFWVTVDYVTSILSIHGTFGNISYSQMNFLPIVQIASITGIWGISFSMFLFAARWLRFLVPVPSRRRFRRQSALAFFWYGYSDTESGDWRRLRRIRRR
jgi:apolipoprotein N-acyltransferase